ncbi:MAG: ABC transporter substrate-binding protein [Candidatus Thorarchaeota archaeon]
MKKEKPLLSLTLAVFLILPVFAFIPTTVVAQTPKIVKIGMFEEPDSLNPVMAAKISAWEFINWIFDPLVRWDDDWGIQPGLAESWEWAANGSQLVMHMDPDAAWHDGTPFTAHDANWTLFTWTWLGFWVGQTPRIDHRNIRVPDDHTLVLNFVDSGYENITEWALGGLPNNAYNGTPVAINKEAFLTGLTYVPILAEHLWNPLTWDDPFYGREGSSGYFQTFGWQDCIWWGMLDPAWPTPLNGTGAFMLDEYVVGEYIKLDANPNYHLGAPNIDGILITFYDTVEVMTEAVKAGDIDFCETAPAFIELGIIPDTVTINENPWMGWEGLLVNQYYNYTNAQGEYAGRGAKHNALLEHAVRKAMNQAIDKAQIAEVAYLGHANAADSLIHTVLKWHNDDLITYPKGAVEARATLEAAGWVENLDGVYEKDISGTLETLSFEIKYVTGIPTDFTIVSLVSAYLEAAGFEITTVPLEETTFTADITTEVWNYDIALTFYSQIADPNSMMQYMTSDSWINPNGVNITRVDEIYKEQQLTDDVTRAQLCDEFQQIMYNDSSIIVLVEFNDIELYRNDVWTFTNTDWASGILSMWNLNSWLGVDEFTPSTTTTPSTGTTTPPPPPPLPMELLLLVGVGAVVLVLVVVLVIRRR